MNSSGTQTTSRTKLFAAIIGGSAVVAMGTLTLAMHEQASGGSTGVYLSTGGGWSPATAASIRSLADQPGTQLVAATDANAQGEAFAVRLREIADAAGCDWIRLKPPAEDWNDALRMHGLRRQR